MYTHERARERERQGARRTGRRGEREAGERPRREEGTRAGIAGQVRSESREASRSILLAGRREGELGSDAVSGTALEGSKQLGGALSVGRRALVRSVIFEFRVRLLEPCGCRGAARVRSTPSWPETGIKEILHVNDNEPSAEYSIRT